MDQGRTAISVELSPSELRAVISMLEDQLFRVKFIDPKLPGYKLDVERLQAAQSAPEAPRVPGKPHMRPPAGQTPSKAAEPPQLPNSRILRGPAMNVVNRGK